MISKVNKHKKTYSADFNAPGCLQTFLIFWLKVPLITKYNFIHYKKNVLDTFLLSAAILMTIVMRQEGEINLFLLVLFFKIDIFCAFIASKYILNDEHCNCIEN